MESPTVSLASLMQRAADPPVNDPISHVIFSNDMLTIDSRPPNHSNLVVALVIAGASIAVMSVGCATESVAMCCIGLPLFLIGIPMILFGYQRRINAQFQRLKISPQGVEFSEGKSVDDPKDFTPTLKRLIPLHKLQNHYLYIIDKAEILRVSQQKNRKISNFLLQTPGIVFVDAQNQEYTFGKGMLTRGKASQYRKDLDDREIRWVYEIVEDYLQVLTKK